MPFIGLEHFDAFGALSPCFPGAFWIWYLVLNKRSLYYHTHPPRGNVALLHGSDLNIWQMEILVVTLL